MYECDCHIGCLSGSITRVGQGLSGSVSRIGAELCGSITRVGQGLSGSVTLVCSVNKDAYIRFKDSLLLWYDSDNNEGVIKYNTLVASGNWSLEEVEIEELL